MAADEGLGIRIGRTAGAFILNLLAMELVPLSLGVALGKILDPVTKNINATASQIFVGRLWLLTIGAAALTGFFVRQRWKTGTAKWVWVVPVILFLLRVGSLYQERWHSVLVTDSFFASANLWRRFWGTGCNARNIVDCMDFITHTLHLARGISYSVAAYVSGRLVQQPVQEEEVIRPVAFL